MPNNFFARFPTIQYDMDGTGSLLTLTNITKNVDVNDIFANNTSFYTYYDIMDGERPDTVSFRLYDTPSYYWTFFILNNDLRTGLNNGWPLSSHQFERMLVNEYDLYSVITLLPSNGIGVNGLMNLTLLWEAYLPFLRLENSIKTEYAKILKYDSKLLQIVVYDIEKADGSGLVSSTTKFVKESPTYSLTWINPYDSITETEEWNTNEALKLEFVEKMRLIYNVFDTTATMDTSLLPDDVSQADIDSYVLNYNVNYVFGKAYTQAGEKYSWELYRDAAIRYYEEIDSIPYYMSAYDNVLDTAILYPKYITRYQDEENKNVAKSKIRVIRPDQISAFVNSYFNAINE